jgi:hypothetical protein
VLTKFPLLRCRSRLRLSSTMLLTPASQLPKKLLRRSLLLRQMMFKEPKKYRIRLPEKLRLSKITSKRLRTYKRKD